MGIKLNTAREKLTMAIIYNISLKYPVVREIIPIVLPKIILLIGPARATTISSRRGLAKL